VGPRKPGRCFVSRGPEPNASRGVPGVTGDLRSRTKAHRICATPVRERKLRARRPRQGQLDEGLTERELDVLRLFSGELTTRQMAERLYVAPSTVRTQVKSIYRKLGVSSRREAVEEARARGLL
jgi:DNA-binding CsgD family transcriptional regulator